MIWFPAANSEMISFETNYVSIKLKFIVHFINLLSVVNERYCVKLSLSKKVFCYSTTTKYTYWINVCVCCNLKFCSIYSIQVHIQVSVCWKCRYFFYSLQKLHSKFKTNPKPEYVIINSVAKIPFLLNVWVHINLFSIKHSTITSID